MENNGTNSTTNGASELNEALNIIWIIGICVSFIGLLLQIVLYVLIANCRKLDQKILTQLTVTRLIYTICEYVVVNVTVLHPIARDSLFAIYLQSDTMLICWMFVFTKNLYDKVVSVFNLQKFNFTLLSVLIFCLTLPLGMVCPILFYNHLFNAFKIFYRVYSICKFIVLIVNVLYFCRMYSIALKNGRINARNLRNILRTCVVFLTLVCITSVQVLTTDILSFFYNGNEILSKIFCVINSFQVVPMTMIFIGLVNNRCDDS